MSSSKATLQDPSLKLLLFHNSTSYSFTINPDDKVQYSGSKNRWAKVRKLLMEELLQYLPYIAELKLYPDLSIPSPLGGGKYPRIHWHGTIKFKDVIAFYTSYPQCSHYMFDTDTIDDKEYWKEYCKKFLKLHSSYKMYTITLNDLKEMFKHTQPEKTTTVFDFLPK